MWTSLLFILVYSKSSALLWSISASCVAHVHYTLEVMQVSLWTSIIWDAAIITHDIALLLRCKGILKRKLDKHLSKCNFYAWVLALFLIRYNTWFASKIQYYLNSPFLAFFFFLYKVYAFGFSKSQIHSCLVLLCSPFCFHGLLVNLNLLNKSIFSSDEIHSKIHIRGKLNLHLMTVWSHPQRLLWEQSQI